MAQRPPPEYAFPARFVARWLLSWLLQRPRDLGRDGARLFAAAEPAPRFIAEQRIPAQGEFIVVMNHYEPPGLRVWWPALLVSGMTGAGRPGRSALSWLIADRFFRTRWHGIPVPERIVAWAFRQIAGAYGLIVVSRRDPHARATALRRAARTLRQPGNGRSLGVTPEGALASGGVLAEPVPNAALALAWLSRGEIPLLPIAVFYNASGRLTAHVGEPFTLPWCGLRAAREQRDALTRRVMGSLAELMPPALRGPFPGAGDDGGDLESCAPRDDAT